MRIHVDPDANEYVRECVRQAPGEIGGIAYVELLEPSEFYISEFVLLPQSAGIAHVEFESEDYIKEITRAAEEGKEELLRTSWHSHGDMDTYWSSTDEQGIKEYKQLGMPWLVSLVFNKEGDVNARVDIFDHPACSHISLSEVEYVLDEEVDESLISRVKSDLKRCVKKPKPQEQWNKQSGKKDNKGKKDKQVQPLHNEQFKPLYPGWDERYGDDIEWSEDDYEDVANQILKGATDEEEDQIKELMEKNEPFTF